jgi:hypothetical protein
MTYIYEHSGICRNCGCKRTDLDKTNLCFGCWKDGYR